MFPWGIPYNSFTQGKRGNGWPTSKKKDIIDCSLFNTLFTVIALKLFSSGHHLLNTLFIRSPCTCAQTRSSRHQNPKPWNQPTDSGLPRSKRFPFCFLPLPGLPKVLHHFWPLVSESCFLRLGQLERKKTPEAAKMFTLFKWEAGEKTKDRQEHKETTQ